MNFIGHKHYNKKLVSKPIKPKPKPKKKKKKEKVKPSFPQTKSRKLHPVQSQQPMTINIFNIPPNMNQAQGAVHLPNRLGHKVPKSSKSPESPKSSEWSETDDQDYGFEKFEPKPKLKKFKGEKIKLEGDGREAIEERLRDISVHDSSYGSDKDSDYRAIDYHGRIDRIENPNDWNESDGSEASYQRDSGAPYPKRYFKNSVEKEGYIEDMLNDKLYKKRMERFDSDKPPATVYESLMRNNRNDETPKDKRDTREEMRLQRIARFEPPIGNSGIDTPSQNTHSDLDSINMSDISDSDSFDNYGTEAIEEEKANESDDSSDSEGYHFDSDDSEDSDGYVFNDENDYNI